MKKIKLITGLCLCLLSLFLYMDYKTYYYGFGKGLLSSKIPNRFSILFAGSDLGNQGMVLEEKDLNLWIINSNDSIFMTDTNKRILIKKFAGYWFNNKAIVANIIDVSNKKHYIEIYEEMTNKLNPGFILKEIKFPPNEEYDDVKYVDLDKNLNYFKRFKLIKNIIFVGFIFSIIYLIKLIYIERKRI